MCDHNGAERVVNLITSLPYGYVGQHIWRSAPVPASTLLMTCTHVFQHRHRVHRPARLWGASVIGIALGSLAFHAAKGKWKPIGRRYSSVLPHTCPTAQLSTGCLQAGLLDHLAQQLPDDALPVPQNAAAGHHRVCAGHPLQPPGDHLLQHCCGRGEDLVSSPLLVAQ